VFRGREICPARGGNRAIACAKMGVVRINRRRLVGLLAGAAAGPGALAQAPTAPARLPRAQGATPDAALQSAREDLKSDIERIAQVKLPQPVEPAFRFRA
jgi:hypothetical protein